MTKRHKCKEESWYHTPFILANINFCKDKFASWKSVSIMVLVILHKNV